MTTKQRYDGVIAWFSEHMPVAESELHYTDPYQLLVAVILSAQCTDKRVNMTTPALFEAFPTPFDMAAATAEDIYPYIKSISYPCLLYTSPSPRDRSLSRMPSSA